MKLWPLMLLILVPCAAQALEVGDRLAPWTLLDQFDKPYTFNEQTQTLLVARSMDAAKLVNGALQSKPEGFLEARKTVFVADIHKMPALISKMFAVPGMRAYSYRIMLDRDARVVPRYDGDIDKVLWLQVQNGRLVNQQQFSSSDELRAALERP